MDISEDCDNHLVLAFREVVISIYKITTYEVEINY